MVNRTICIAADGFERDLCLGWMEEGLLPNLNQMRMEGAYGSARCQSVSSAQQWTNHFTGVYSDTHGIRGFVREGTVEKGGKYPEARELVNRTDIEVKTYPELLAESGLTVGLVNPLPFWPPLDLDDGVCISGMLTPPDSNDWVYPDSLRKDLEEMDYQIDVQYGSRPRGFIDDDVFDDADPETLSNAIMGVLNSRIECTKYLLKNRDLDYTYSLFKSIDLVQHVFWAAMETNHEEHGSTILEAYQKVDELVGWIREEFPDANLVILSDHGFKEVSRDRSNVLSTVASAVSNHLGPVPLPLRELYLKVNSADDTPDDLFDRITGVHALPAMWMASGPDLRTIDRPLQVRFEDLTASLLTLLNHPVPAAYEGSTCDAVNKEPSRKEISLSKTREKLGSESDVVTDRLHNLGYVDMISDE